MSERQFSGRVLLPVASGQRIRKTLVSYVRPHCGIGILALLLIVAAAAAKLVPPWLLGMLVDDIGATSITRVVWVVVAIVATTLLAGVCTRFGLIYFGQVGERVLAQLREQVLLRALHLPSGILEKAGTGDIISRSGNDISVLSSAFLSHGPDFISTVLFVVVTLVGFVVLEWRLAVPAVVAMTIVYVWAMRVYMRKSIALNSEDRVATGELSQALISSLRGRKTVRAYQLEKDHIDLIGERAGNVRDINIALRKTGSQFYFRLKYAETVGLIFLLIASFWGVRSGFATAGEVTTVTLYSLQLFQPVVVLLNNINVLPSARVSLARLVGVIEMPQVSEPTSSRPPADTSLVLRKVNHRYDEGPPVLTDISLRIEPGERVAVVGASGAGKTTLANIAAGVLTPHSGTVSLGGVSLAELGESRYQSKVSLISQDIHVFSGPLVEDVRLANADADDKEVLAALQKIGAENWVLALPEGIYTELGELGHHLTAAQAQQLALARLVLADPDVAILDEATAEAGSAGARELEQAAGAAIAGRTALIVAHRLTQAVLADRIVVMHEGHIVEVGSHAELVSAGGRYSRLWGSWSGSGVPQQ